jgi:hypothetical protein
MLSHTQTKKEYIMISAQIKRTVKEIKQQQLLLVDKITDKRIDYDVKLFEVEPSETSEQSIDYSELESIFGII